MKWAEDEKLGDKASTAAVLYSNTHHPDLQQKYPEFNDRAKQINKLWRKLCPEDRVQWVVRPCLCFSDCLFAFYLSCFF